MKKKIRAAFRRFKLWFFRKLLGIESGVRMRWRLERAAFIRSLLWAGERCGEYTPWDDAYVAEIVNEREHNRYKINEAI